MKKHILLIDNDKHELDYFLDALKEVPEEDGFKCTYVNSAIEATQLLKKLVPHFIFIDKTLRPWEIMNILQSIKEEIRLYDAKIFLYTNTHEQPDQLFSSFGVKGWVKKTRSPDKLSKRLTTCLSA
jgi:DNA-binding response OmpR family regulator